jgi:hypothetical protein
MMMPMASEPEVDDIVPLYSGKRWILCMVPSRGQYGIWDGRDVAKPPQPVFTDWPEAWTAFVKLELAPQKCIVRCPTCRSRWVAKITTGDKLGEWAVLGIFAVGKIAKTFRCSRCSYTW